MKLISSLQHHYETQKYIHGYDAFRIVLGHYGGFNGISNKRRNGGELVFIGFFFSHNLPLMVF